LQSTLLSLILLLAFENLQRFHWRLALALLLANKNAPQGEIAKHVEAYCRDITFNRNVPRSTIPTSIIHGTSNGGASADVVLDPLVLPPRFGQFGGQYVPEALFDCLIELESAHNTAIKDTEFWKEFEGHFGYMNRPSKFYFAEKLTAHAGGAKIWLKREDLYVSYIF